MESGIYEARFETNGGEIGVTAVMIRRNAFVGADGLQFYRGYIEQRGTAVTVKMKVVRHNLSAVGSPFGDEPEFSLEWQGRSADDRSFELACTPGDSALTVRVQGRLLSPL